MATNLWSQFKELLPSDALQIGTVREIDGDRSRIELPDGAFLWVAGSTVPVGSGAIFKGERWLRRCRLPQKYNYQYIKAWERCIAFIES